MNKLIISFSLALLTFALNAQNIKSDSCKGGNDDNPIEINTHNNIENRIILENTIKPSIILKAKKVKIDNELFKEFRKDNYSPKEIYFRVVAKELKILHKEMLT